VVVSLTAPSGRPRKMGCAGAKASGKVIEHSADANCAADDFNRDFVLGEKLGQGAFASVFTARKACGGELEVAVKVIDVRREGRRFAEREAAITRELPVSQYVIRSYGLCDSGDFVYLLMEKCEIGLLDALERFPRLTLPILHSVFRDMVSGLLACHIRGIVHRDVKHDNFLAMRAASPSGFVFKLCDFGFASQANDRCAGVYGSPPYMAPEMLALMPYSSKVDVWSFGVVAYTLLFGTWPYAPATLTGTAMKAAIRSGKPAPRFCGEAALPIIPTDASSWVQTLLRRTPAVRPKAEEALRHQSFATGWERCSFMLCLRPTLNAAKRVGAFRLPGLTGKSAGSDLDEIIIKLNDAYHESVRFASSGCASDETSQ